MPLPFFNPLPNGAHANLLTVNALSNNSFSGKHNFLLNIHIYFNFLLINLKPLQFTCQNNLNFGFDQFCYGLCSFSCLKSFFDRFCLNLNGLSDNKAVSFTENENNSLV